MSDFNEIHRNFSLTLSRYKPYVNPDLQRLSSVCCILLVTMSSVLLRSQSLLSSARFINFDPSNPVEAAETQTVDVNYTIIILIGCIFTPFAVALKLHHVLLACFTLLKKRRMRRKQHGHFFTGALSATTCKVDLESKTHAASLSEDMSSVGSTTAVADAPSVRSQSAHGNHEFSAQASSVLPASPATSHASDNAFPTTGVFQEVVAPPRSRSRVANEPSRGLHTRIARQLRARPVPPPVSILSVASRVASGAAASPAVSHASDNDILTPGVFQEVASASGNVFSAQALQHNVDLIVPERFGGMKSTQSEASAEHLCDPVDIDLTEYNDCGDDASSIRTIFFRRPKSFQLHQNRAEAFVVHLGDTISSPSEAASSAFARPGALRIDVLDALDDLSTSLPVVTAAEADAATS